jgi:hypothetical protein
MRRNSLIPLACLLLLVGCGRSGEYRSYGGLMADRVMSPEEQQSFSYTHVLSLLMGHDAVKPRYDRARERCLHDASLNCKLISAGMSVGDFGDANGASAQMQVALPHDKVSAYEAGLLQPLPGEGRAAEVQSRSTRAESVENEATDLDRKIAQLTAYRDGLAVIAKRPNLSVGDLIKVEGELAKTQTDLDQATAQKREVNDRIARERLSVFFGERPSVTAPLARVWRDASNTLIDSLAAALQFLIEAVPWLPIMLGIFFLVRWLWRLARRRSGVAAAKPAASDSG